MCPNSCHNHGLDNGHSTSHNNGYNMRPRHIGHKLVLNSGYNNGYNNGLNNAHNHCNDTDSA